MDDARRLNSELAESGRRLRRHIPDVYTAYAELHRATLSDGALDAKTKELIALAIAITRECDGCIASHARGAVRHGATEQEVAETIGVTILMNGGPGTVFGPRAFDAFHDFADHTPGNAGAPTSGGASTGPAAS